MENDLMNVYVSRVLKKRLGVDEERPKSA